MLPGPPASERLRMENVHKRFGATVALAGVSLRVNAGEVLALVGENGAGKSTLMKVLSGAHRPDHGQMFLDSAPYRPRNPLEARRAGVAMIYQELSLARHLSVMENIVLGMEPTAGPLLNWRAIRQIAAEALAQLGRGDIPLHALVGELSIAEQQLVEIGRAVAVGCRVLVLDEPTSSLTARDIRRLFDLVQRLRQRGHGIIYISHFLEEVKEISDRFTVLRDGQSVGSGATAQTSPGEIIAMMVGRTVSDLYPRSQRQRGEAILEVQRLSAVQKQVSPPPMNRKVEPTSPSAEPLPAHPGQVHALETPGQMQAGGAKLRMASLSLHRGEVLGIAGLVGAGRTPLLRAIFGLDPVRSGRVRVGVYAGPASPARRWGQGVGMVSEDRKVEGLALNLSIADNITLSNLPALLRPARQAADSRPWIERLGVRCRSPHQPVGDLSGGNQQKVALARLLHHDVDVLLLDEPTRGIDVGSKATIYRAIDDLARQGKAILMVSSYLPELLGVCDRIAVMCRGILGPARPVGQLTEHQIMLEATGAGVNGAIA